MEAEFITRTKWWGLIADSMRFKQDFLELNSKYLDEFNAERNRLADRYFNEIKNPYIRLPKVRPGADSSWHQFVIHVPEFRDELIEYLKDQGIGTIIHYPIPPHLSQAYQEKINKFMQGYHAV